MTTEKMNIHKALVELKTLDSRIGNSIMEVSFVMANKHSNTKIDGVSVSEVCAQVTSTHQKVTDLINRRNAIKRAVVMSNALTSVTIGSQKYTVAEAIEMKNHGLDFYKSLKNKMSLDLRNAERICNSNNGETLETKANSYIQNLYENADMKSASEDIKRVKADFLASQTYELVDPVKVKEKILDLQDFINEFETEVDAALSVSNAVTEIEISY